MTTIFLHGKQNGDKHQQPQQQQTVVNERVENSLETDINNSEYQQVSVIDHHYETIPANELGKYVVLGEGKFGVVVEGNLNSKAVAIKKSKNDPEAIQNLWKESKILSHIGKHPNIVEFLGSAVPTENGNHTGLIIMELSPLGSLKSFIQENRFMFVHMTAKNCAAFHCGYERPVLTTKNLFNWSLQIATGMKYLESKQVIHRDLAIRNVLVFDNDVVKIADFGLAQKIHSPYMRQGETLYVPWRYMPLEALCEKEFSSKSDVWSYGVTIWEIFSLGQEPYDNFDHIPTFMNHLLRGERLTKPTLADDDVYDLMTKCWHHSPAHRPNFQEIETLFQTILHQFSFTG